MLFPRSSIKLKNIAIFTTILFVFLASTISTLLIAIDRLFAICFPLQRKQFKSFKRVQTVTALSWILCFVISGSLGIILHYIWSLKIFWYPLAYLSFGSALLLITFYLMIYLSMR